ncbi:DUF4395 domain-containing protein [Saccharicrinis sp. FJH54]|uniref:DUF4395 domain-containing protein n=1 Tax=Saccharicrinis sp. FJH54 TaxID=3344665 RepID=UPI0035D40248
MEKLCPITFKSVDNHVARLNSSIIIVLFALFFATGSPVVIAFIFLDFLVRGFWEPAYSPVARTSKYILSNFQIKPKMINAGPKIFAAQVGTFISGAVLFCAVTGFSTIGCYFAGILVFFALLESAFSYCVACKLYPFLRKR